MKTRTLEILFGIIALLVIILFVALSVVSSDADFGGMKEITGSMETFEIPDQKEYNPMPTKENTQRYDNKLIEYKDHIGQRRDESFLK